MPQKILIDSDVCLDSITNRQPHQEVADPLFEHLEHTDAIGIVSAESFSNMFYLLRKYYNATKAVRTLQELETIVQIGTLQPSTIQKALVSGWKDFEDAIQYYCATEHGCKAIITRNRTDFTLPVLTPFEFLTQQ